MRKRSVEDYCNDSVDNDDENQKESNKHFRFDNERLRSLNNALDIYKELPIPFEDDCSVCGTISTDREISSLRNNLGYVQLVGDKFHIFNKIREIYSAELYSYFRIFLIAIYKESNTLVCPISALPLEIILCIFSFIKQDRFCKIIRFTDNDKIKGPSNVYVNALKPSIIFAWNKGMKIKEMKLEIFRERPYDSKKVTIFYYQSKYTKYIKSKDDDNIYDLIKKEREGFEPLIRVFLARKEKKIFQLIEYISTVSTEHNNSTFPIDHYHNIPITNSKINDLNNRINDLNNRIIKNTPIKGDYFLITCKSRYWC
jgi:hypothetical protein